MSFCFPRWCQSSPLQHISESWQMPRCPPCYLCLTPSVCLPIGTLFCRHSSSLSLLLSSFLPDYISGDFDSITAEVRAFFSDKVSGTQFAHTILQMYTQKYMEIKAKGLQTDIMKFELSWGGRVVAPFIQLSLGRCPAGLPGAGTCIIGYSLYLIRHSCQSLPPVYECGVRLNVKRFSQRNRNTARKCSPFAISPLQKSKPVFFHRLTSAVLVNNDEAIPGDLILVLYTDSFKITS